MIKDKIENIGLYSINANFEQFKKFVLSNLKKLDSANPESPLRKIPLNYTTKKQELNKFGCHRKNIDFHYVVKGQEKIFINNNKSLNPIMEFDETGDYQLFESNTIEENICLREGEFLLLFPHEIHMTGNILNESCEVVKNVYKIPV